MGPSGVGKSRILRTLAGLDEVGGGHMELNITSAVAGGTGGGRTSTRSIIPVAPLMPQWRCSVLNVPQDIPQMPGTPLGLLQEADLYTARTAAAALAAGRAAAVPADRARLEESCFAMARMLSTGHGASSVGASGSARRSWWPLTFARGRLSCCLTSLPRRLMPPPLPLWSSKLGLTYAYTSHTPATFRSNVTTNLVLPPLTRSSLSLNN